MRAQPFTTELGESECEMRNRRALNVKQVHIEMETFARFHCAAVKMPGAKYERPRPVANTARPRERGGLESPCVRTRVAPLALPCIAAVRYARNTAKDGSKSAPKYIRGRAVRKLDRLTSAEGKSEGVQAKQNSL